jgi:hypothetical protein
MKHILNNLTEEEKNSIREQHTGTLKVMTENFSRLVESKLGDVKPILSEQSNQISAKEDDIYLGVSSVTGKQYKLFISWVNNNKVDAYVESYPDENKKNDKVEFILKNNTLIPIEVEWKQKYGIFKNLKKISGIKHPYITKKGQVFRAIRNIDNRPYKLVVASNPNDVDLSGNYPTEIAFEITGPGEYEGKPLSNTGLFLNYDPANPNEFEGNTKMGIFTIIR